MTANAQSVSPWAGQLHKSLERLKHFLFYYCGESIASRTTGGWKSFWIPTMYGSRKVSTPEGPYTEYIEKLVIERKAHGFLVTGETALAIYWWGDGEEWNVPGFEFLTNDAPEFQKKQEELKQQAVKDSIDAGS